MLEYETIRRYYMAGAWDETMLCKAVEKGKITQEQAENMILDKEKMVKNTGGGAKKFSNSNPCRVQPREGVR